MSGRLRTLLAGLLLLAVAALTGLLFHDNPGRAALSMGPLGSLDGPLPAIVLGAFLIGVFSTLLLIGLRRLTRGAFAFRGERRHRRHEAAQRLRDEGIERLWSGQTPAGARLLERAVERRPDDLEAALALADALLQLGENERAQRVLHDAQAVLGPLPRLLARRADLQEAASNRGAAVESCREAFHRLPSSPHLLGRLAGLLAAEGQFEEAIEFARRRIAAEPVAPRRQAAREAWLTLRYRAACAAPDGAETRQLFGKILAESQSFLPAQIALADQMSRAGDRRGAERILGDAARREPVGIVLERLRKIATETSSDAACKRLRDVVARAPGPVPKLFLARALAAAGQADAAAEQLSGVDASEALAPECELVAGEIAKVRGLETAAAMHFQRAATGPHLAFGYRCGSCGRIEADWRDACGCGRFGSYDLICASPSTSVAEASARR